MPTDNASLHVTLHTHMPALNAPDVPIVKVKLIANKDLCAIFRSAPGLMCDWLSLLCPYKGGGAEQVLLELAGLHNGDDHHGYHDHKVWPFR